MEPYSSINTDKPSPVLIWKFFSFLPRFSLSHNNVLFTDLLPSIPSCFQSWFKLRRLFIFEHHSWSSTFFYSGVWLRSQRIPPPPTPPHLPLLLLRWAFLPFLHVDELFVPFKFLYTTAQSYCLWKAGPLHWCWLKLVFAFRVWTLSQNKWRDI